MEISAALSRALPADVNYSKGWDPDEPELLPLSNTIIVLPRIVTMIRPVTNSHKRIPWNHVWNDTAAWSRDTLIEMLEKVTQLTGAKTIPSPAEYAILPDKVSIQSGIMHTVMQQYNCYDDIRAYCT